MSNFGQTVVIEDNVEVVTTYRLCFNYDDSKPGTGGFSFPCDKDGNVDPALNSCARENYEKCLNGEHKVGKGRVEKYVGHNRLCSCGSGEHPEDVHDARGIFVARVCSKCRKERLKGYRPEIFTDSDYWHDEPISDEHFDY